MVDGQFLTVGGKLGSRHAELKLHTGGSHHFKFGPHDSELFLGMKLERSIENTLLTLDSKGQSFMALSAGSIHLPAVPKVLTLEDVMSNVEVQQHQLTAAQVKGYMKHEKNGIFDYADYRIRLTNSANQSWVILRRYSALNALHKALRKAENQPNDSKSKYPPFPAKKMFSSGESKEFLVTRSSELETWLQALLKVPGVFQSQFLFSSFVDEDTVLLSGGISGHKVVLNGTVFDHTKYMMVLSTGLTSFTIPTRFSVLSNLNDQLIEEYGYEGMPFFPRKSPKVLSFLPIPALQHSSPVFIANREVKLATWLKAVLSSTLIERSDSRIIAAIALAQAQAAQEE